MMNQCWLMKGSFDPARLSPIKWPYQSRTHDDTHNSRFGMGHVTSMASMIGRTYLRKLPQGAMAAAGHLVGIYFVALRWLHKLPATKWGTPHHRWRPACGARNGM
jgi:hypothetical protein